MDSSREVIRHIVAFYVEARAGNCTADEMVPLLSLLMRQSKMHMKEGYSVMADFFVAEVFISQNLHQ